MSGPLLVHRLLFYLVSTLVRLVDGGVECQSRRSASTHVAAAFSADPCATRKQQGGRHVL